MNPNKIHAIFKDLVGNDGFTYSGRHYAIAYTTHDVLYSVLVKISALRLRRGWCATMERTVAGDAMPVAFSSIESAVEYIRRHGLVIRHLGYDGVDVRYGEIFVCTGSGLHPHSIERIHIEVLSRRS